MNNIERVILYPFDIQSSPILRHKQLLKDYDIVGVVSPEGWGLSGEDAGKADYGSKLYIDVESDFSKSLRSCDSVFFVDSFYGLDFEKEIYPKMLECIEAKKNILALMDIQQEFQDKLEQLCRNNNVYYKNLLLEERIIYTVGKEDNIIKIDIPVIFVVGLAERLNKFELQLALREKLIKLGYSVSQIGSRKFCELMGFHSFPEFMHSTYISEVEKIVLFNLFVKQIELREKPDVIIIGIPGGTMMFNNEYTNKFGIFAYEISQAITPDLVVFSTLYEDFTPDYFKKISHSSKYRFGFEIDCFNLANTIFDMQKLGSLEKDLYLKLSSSFIDEKVNFYRNQGIQVYNALNDNDLKMLVNYIVEKLSEYGEIDII